MNIPRCRNRPAAILALFSSLFLLSSGAGRCQDGPPPIPPGSLFPLNSWSLSAPPWDSDYGDPARSFTGLNVASGWSDAGTCLSLDTNSQAFLNIEVYQQPDNWTNINVASSNGSLSFWYQPNYTSVADGGNGPGNWAALFNIGAYTTNASVGDWLLAIDPPASNILFLTTSNGSRQVVFRYPIDMDAGDWWQIGVSWSETNTCLYLNGQMATNCGPVGCRPTYSECLEYGFFVGSLGTNGDGQARGQFQDLFSYDYPQTADESAQDYARVSAAILGWGGTTPGGGGFHANDSGPPPIDTNGGSGGFSGPEISIPSYSFTSNYSAYGNFWLVASNSPGGVLLGIYSTLSNLTYQICTNSDLSTSNWGLWQTVTATNNITLTPPLEPGSNALFFKGTLVWSTTTLGLPDWWAMQYFGTLDIDPSAAYGSGLEVSITRPANNSTIP